MGIFRKMTTPAVSRGGAGDNPASDAQQSGALLSPGRHVVDGAPVDVPADGRPLVLYPLSPGRHVIDGKVAIVPVMPTSA